MKHLARVALMLIVLSGLVGCATPIARFGVLSKDEPSTWQARPPSFHPSLIKDDCTTFIYAGLFWMMTNIHYSIDGATRKLAAELAPPDRARMPAATKKPPSLLLRDLAIRHTHSNLLVYHQSCYEIEAEAEK